MKWDPTRYAQFADLRGRPFHDLVGRVGAKEPSNVVDLGCGPGELTVSLAERWPGASILGLDASPEMVERAQAREAPGNVSFRLADAAGFDASDTDVLISNAMLQWVPEHPALIARWAGELAPGAWIAFQIPGNFAAPSHARMRELAASEKWRDKLEGVLRGEESVLEPGAYLEIVAGQGVMADVWETTYYQVLPGEDPVLDWTRGTALRPVMAALSAEDYEAFEREYADLMRRAYPRSEVGTVFPFRRQFVVGVKQG